MPWSSGELCWRECTILVGSLMLGRSKDRRQTWGSHCPSGFGGWTWGSTQKTTCVMKFNDEYCSDIVRKCSQGPYRTAQRWSKEVWICFEKFRQTVLQKGKPRERTWAHLPSRDSQLNFAIAQALPLECQSITELWTVQNTRVPRRS
jgi:hypothetical protein